MIIIETFQDLFQNFRNFFEVFALTWWIFLPPMLYLAFKAIWMDFIWGRYAGSVQYQLLEIIPPRDVEKSPKLMESFYFGLAGSIGTISTAEELTMGRLPDKFSLELVSDDGKVHFYIRTPKAYINLIEAHFYAQYPDMIIQAVEDYVGDVPKMVPNANWELWGADFELQKPDPYPIRTYKYFEETVTGKMIDPLSAILESMGKIGLNQKLWLQFVIIPAKESWAGTEAQKHVDKITGKAKKAKGFGAIFSDLFSDFFTIAAGKPVEPKKEEQAKFNIQALTPGEQDALKVLQENMGKNFFKTKMRMIYLGRKENFDKGAVSGFIGAIKQFNDNNLNSFVPNDISKTYSWYFLTQERLRYRQRKLFRRYKDRDMDGVKFHLSTEELATVFHMPDMSVVAPSITKVEARRGGAPSNLPTQ
jgi:hypothetical protein